MTKRIAAMTTTLLLAAVVTVEAGAFRAAETNGVSDQYIVVLRPRTARLTVAGDRDLPAVESVAASLATQHGARVAKVWDSALPAFLLELKEADARKLARDPRVEVVEQDRWIFLDDLVSAPAGNCYELDSFGYQSLYFRTPPSSSPQSIACSDPDPTHDQGAPWQPPLCQDNWGLDRVDQRGNARNGLYFFDRTGAFPPPQPSVPVTIYFMDTGINAVHSEFLDHNGNSRAIGTNVTNDLSCAPTTDPIGHGTHVAAIAAGRTFGVAKGARVHVVRFTACSNPWTFNSWILNGLNFVAGMPGPAVLNWSGGNALETTGSQAIRNAAQGVLNSGKLVVQSAGNQSSPYVLPGTSPTSYPTGVEDACNWSFGGWLAGVLVVGGVDHNQARWTRYYSGDLPEAFCPSDCGSNVGSCISLWAPASNILSAAGRYNTTDLYCRLSGTSMAAPFAAGAAALYLEANPTASPAAVKAALVNNATTGVLNANPNTPNHIGPLSPNRLLYTRF